MPSDAAANFLHAISERAAEIRTLRDVHGWPEPRTVDELRNDPRYRLRNRLGGAPEEENLVLAGALLLLIAEDHYGQLNAEASEADATQTHGFARTRITSGGNA